MLIAFIRLVALALAAALPVRAAEPLSFDQALRIAEDRSRQLPAQDAAASAAREMAIAAGQRPDPTLKAGVNNLPIDGPDRFSVTRDFMTMRSIGIMQDLTRSGKLKARSARFEREAEVADAGRDLALANLQRDTAAAWLDRYYQERMRDVLVSQRDEARLQIEAADSAYRGGRGSQADAFAARAAVALIEDRMAQSERQIATARTQLSRWIGPPAEREEASRMHLAEALAMLQEWQSNRERLAHYDSTLVPLSTERTRAALAAYRGGGPLAAVLEARRMEIDTRMDRLRLEMDTARLWAQINYLVPAGPAAPGSR